MGANDARLKLHSLKNVNTALGLLYDKDGNYREGLDPAEFYDTILLDTLQYGEENYVHLKYAENLTIRKGRKTARFRRWAGMTPTLRPLLEGVPPAPDKHAYETLEIGNVWSFGRWSEYTDQVDMSHVSEIISERTLQYGELANQIKELYARKIWLSSPNEYYANFKAGFQDLAFGDSITLDDLRYLIQRMKRMQVKPISGKFNYICSPEFISGLIDDPRVVQYMEIENTTGKLWGTGEPFDMFEINFIPTMLDEFAYPDTEFPGIFEADGVEYCRFFTRIGNVAYYLDVHPETAVGAGKAKTITNDTYLPDGTAIDVWEKWDIQGIVLTSKVKAEGTPEKDMSVLKKSTLTKEDGKSIWGAVVSGVEDVAKLADATWFQLPVHRGILFGDEALVKLNVEGISDAPRMIIKALGSAGTADPLDQRQTVGFRVDGFGLAIKRPEAICITFGIPENAEFAAYTADYYYGDYTLLDNGQNASTDANHVDDATNTQSLHVDGVNDTRIFVKFSEDVNYSEGTYVMYNGESYVFIKGHKAGAWNAAHVKAVNSNIKE